MNAGAIVEDMLDELCAVPGILAGLVYDVGGTVVALRAPPTLERILGEVLRAMTEAEPHLLVLTGRPQILDLHFAHLRVVTRPMGRRTVLVVCDKAATQRGLVAEISRVVEGLERPRPALPPASSSTSTSPAVAPPVVLPAVVPPADAPPADAPSGDVRRARRLSADVLFADVPADDVPPAAPADVRPAVEARPSPTPTPPASPPITAPRPWLPWALAGGGALVVAVLGLTWALLRPAPAVPLPAAAAPAAAAPLPAAQILLRIGGAGTMAEELAPALAQAYLSSLGAEDVRVERGEAYRFTVRGLQGGAPVALTVVGMPTPKGFDELAAGNLDIAMSGRRIRPEWQEKAAALGTLSAPGSEHVVALSGIAIVVNPTNPVAKLDSRQLAAVFSGHITDWAALGRRSGGAVHVYATPDAMGLTDLFKGVVLGSAGYAADARRVPTLQAMNDAVAQDPDGIGFLTLPFVRGTRAVAVSEADEPPLIPTAFTVATEDYFLTHRLFLYTPPAAKNPHTLRFVQFALGAGGQEVVRRSGYAELSVAAERREARARAPSEYVRLTRDARRLTSTFRFEVGSPEFDARSLVDVDRVARYVVDGRLAGASVRILGFADSQGSRTQNDRLSLARAQLVAKAFELRGIHGAVVRGFGSELPVASNATPEGRERNRRVEVWVTH